LPFVFCKSCGCIVFFSVFVSLTDLLAAALDTHSGLWAPFPVWFIGALVFVMQMASAPSSGSKRACVALLIAWALWLVLFIVVMTLVGILGDLYGVVIVPSVMIPILFVLMIAFVIVADVAFRAAHGPVNGDLGDMRTLRGVHLGLNLAGMFIFPIFTYIGVPLTIAKIARHRRTTGCFGGTAAFGVLTLLFLTIVILVASITSGIRSDYGPIDYYNCRKRSVLQVQNSTTVTGTTTGFTTGFTTIDPTTDPTTIYATIARLRSTRPQTRRRRGPGRRQPDSIGWDLPLFGTRLPTTRGGPRPQRRATLKRTEALGAACGLGWAQGSGVTTTITPTTARNWTSRAPSSPSLCSRCSPFRSTSCSRCSPTKSSSRISQAHHQARSLAS
jgi:hypothetical protein